MFNCGHCTNTKNYELHNYIRHLLSCSGMQKLFPDRKRKPRSRTSEPDEYSNYDIWVEKRRQHEGV